MSSSMLEDFGWRYFWDSKCTVAIEKGDVFPVESGQSVTVYFACVPKKVNKDGTVTKYTIQSNQAVVQTIASISDILNKIKIGGTKEGGTSISGDIEEVVVFDEGYSVDEIKSYHVEKKTLFSENSDDEMFFNTREDAISSKVISFFAFADRNSVYHDIIDSEGQIVMHGTGSLVQGRNRAAVSIVNESEYLEIQEMKLEYEFAISVRLRIDASHDFTLIDIPNVLTLKYNYSRRVLIASLYDFFFVKENIFETESVGKLFGDTIDIAICIKKGSIEIVLDGQTLSVSKFDFMLYGIKDYIGASHLIKSASVSGFGSVWGSSNHGAGYFVELYKSSKQVQRILSSKKNCVFDYFYGNLKCNSNFSGIPETNDTWDSHYVEDSRGVRINFSDPYDYWNHKTENKNFNYNSVYPLTLHFKDQLPVDIPTNISPIALLSPTAKNVAIRHDVKI